MRLTSLLDTLFKIFNLTIMSQITAHLANHIRQIHFGVNWTWSNLKDNLSNISWQQATTKIDNFNTILALTYHINYFVGVIVKVLEGGPLEGSDKVSFDHPPVQSKEEWEKFLDKVWSDGEKMANLVENLPEETLWKTFSEEKYGNYYRNIQGIIEHSHYHLGQIVIIKKLIVESSKGAE